MRIIVQISFTLFLIGLVSCAAKQEAMVSNTAKMEKTEKLLRHVDATTVVRRNRWIRGGSERKPRAALIESR